MGGKTLNYFLLPHHTGYNMVQSNPEYGAHLVHISVMAGSAGKWFKGPLPGKRQRISHAGRQTRPVISPAVSTDAKRIRASPACSLLVLSAPLRFDEVVEGELEPDGEEQEHDPDLTEGRDRSVVRDEPKTIGPGKHADNDERDDGWDFEWLADVQKQDRKDRDSRGGKHEIRYATSRYSRSGSRAEAALASPCMNIPPVMGMPYLHLTVMPDASCRRILIRSLSKNQTPQNSSAPGLI